MKEQPDSHEDYIKGLKPEQCIALENLRVDIKAIIPEAKECISYGIPAFRYRGKILVGYGASSKHCALYMFNSSVLEKFKKDLQGYDISKGTLRFKAHSQLPIDLIRDLIHAKIKEMDV